MENLYVGMPVSYRYMTVPPGTIKAMSEDKTYVLLEVDEPEVKFERWVHWTSVNPKQGRKPKQKPMLPISMQQLNTRICA